MSHFTVVVEPIGNWTYFDRRNAKWHGAVSHGVRNGTAPSRPLCEIAPCRDGMSKSFGSFPFLAPTTHMCILVRTCAERCRIVRTIVHKPAPPPPCLCTKVHNRVHNSAQDCPTCPMVVHICAQPWDRWGTLVHSCAHNCAHLCTSGHKYAHVCGGSKGRK